MLGDGKDIQKEREREEKKKKWKKAGKQMRQETPLDNDAETHKSCNNRSGN